jgi:hypothetical protein
MMKCLVFVPPDRMDEATDVIVKHLDAHVEVISLIGLYLLKIDHISKNSDSFLGVRQTGAQCS